MVENRLGCKWSGFRPDFKCFWILNGQISDPLCTDLNRKSKVFPFQQMSVKGSSISNVEGLDPSLINSISFFCSRLWNSNGNITLDPFGRMKTEAQGFLYFISHGKKHLYCASKEIFSDSLQQQVTIVTIHY